MNDLLPDQGQAVRQVGQAGGPQGWQQLQQDIYGGVTLKTNHITHYVLTMPLQTLTRK